jgi:hypothetical protein
VIICQLIVHLLVIVQNKEITSLFLFCFIFIEDPLPVQDSILQIKRQSSPFADHEGIWGECVIHPFILDLGTAWREWSVSRNGRLTPVPTKQEVQWAPRRV